MQMNDNFNIEEQGIAEKIFFVHNTSVWTYTSMCQSVARSSFLRMETLGNEVLCEKKKNGYIGGRTFGIDAGWLRNRKTE